MRYALLLCCTASLLSGCALWREEFRSQHKVVARHHATIEAGLISLYRDGTFSASWPVVDAHQRRHAQPDGATPYLLEKHAADGYWQAPNGRKYFVLYHPANRTFYILSIWNCTSGSPAGNVKPGCSVVIQGISTLQPDSTVEGVEWQHASPVMKAFRRHIMPVIRQRVTLLDARTDTPAAP